MAAEAKQTCYEGSEVQTFQFYLEQSGEHQAIVQSLHSLLPAQFKRYTRSTFRQYLQVSTDDMSMVRSL